MSLAEEQIHYFYFSVFITVLISVTRNTAVFGCSCSRYIIRKLWSAWCRYVTWCFDQRNSFETRCCHPPKIPFFFFVSKAEYITPVKENSVLMFCQIGIPWDCWTLIACVRGLSFYNIITRIWTFFLQEKLLNHFRPTYTTVLFLVLFNYPCIF